MNEWPIGEVVAGAASGTGAVAVAAAIRPFVAGRPWPIAGVLFAVAAGGALALVASLPWAVVLGVAGIAGAVELSRGRLPPWMAVLPAAPFAVLLATDGAVPDVAWMRILVGLTASVGAVLAAAADERWQDDALGPVLLAATVVGIALVVPDTEAIAVLVGTSVPIAVLGWPARLATLRASGAAAATALTVWVAATETAGRPASLVGAVACFGLLLTGAAGTGRHLGRCGSAVPVIVGQGVIVLVAARVVGRGDDVVVAALLALALALLALVGSIVLGGTASDRLAE